MLDFKRFSWGLGCTTLGLAGLSALAFTWLKLGMPIEPIYGFLGLGSLGLSWLGLIVSASLDTKKTQEDYAEAKLLADFLRELVFPTILREPGMRSFIIDRLVNDMLFQPEQWRPVAVKLAPGTKQIIVEFCRQKILELSRQAALEAQNGEVDGSANREMRLRDEIFQIETLVRGIASQ